MTLKLINCQYIGRWKEIYNVIVYGCYNPYYVIYYVKINNECVERFACLCTLDVSLLNIIYLNYRAKWENIIIWLESYGLLYIRYF